MDRSFIVEAQCTESGAPKKVVAVVFMNSEPSKGLLADLGLTSISSLSEARPASGQPTEPTLYVFEKGGKGVRIKRFDWHGSVTSSENVCGEPYLLVPPVRGPAAESLLYVPSAYVISGMVRSGSRLEPVVAVLCIKPEPGKAAPKPEMKTLRRMGLDKIQSVEEVSLVGQVSESAVYIFERSPSARGLSVKRGENWEREETIDGVPHELLPQLSGPAADRFVYPRNGLGKGDFPRAPSVPPSRGSSVRPAAPDEMRDTARRSRSS